MKLASIGLTGEVGPWDALGFDPDGAGLIGLAKQLTGARDQPKPAVQSGRRIATVHREAGLTTAAAFMDR